MSADRRPRWSHLARRLYGTWRARPLDEDELAWVRHRLRPVEFDLWTAMDWRDQRHALTVAQRFLEAPSTTAGADLAVVAALLHDVGKSVAPLSTKERVLVALVGARTDRQRRYRQHEAIGLDMCRHAGTDPIVLDLLAGIGERDVLAALRRADDL